MRRALAPTLLVLGSAGCTILSGVADLEAAAGGTTAPGADGGVTPASDGAAPPVDAGSDAAPPARDFCDGNPALVCLDFETKSLDPSPARVQVHATLTVDTPGLDSGHALHCVGQDDLAAQCFQAVSLPASPTKVHHRFDVFVESPGTGIELNEIEFTYGTGRCALQPSLVGSVVQVNEFCPEQGPPDQINHDVATLDSTAAAGWYTFDLTLDLVSHVFSGSFTKPGGTVPFGPIALDPRFLTSANVAFHPGMTFGWKATPAPKVRIDNIALDLP